MEFKNIILVLFLLPALFALDLKIVDEDYLEVQLGSKRTPLKLLIDPVGHFTYLLKDVQSSTKVDQLTPYEFSNTFGTFKGEWETDYIFLTDDKEFAFRLNYVAVKEKKDVVLDVDGVIGLGYSDTVPENANIYKILGKMKDVLQMKNVMTYDKKRSKLILGRVPEPDSFNPVSFDINENSEENPMNLVTLDKIGFYPKGSKKPDYVEIAQKAKLGLIPVIVAPNKSTDLVVKEIVPKMTSDANTIKITANERKFFDDVFFGAPNKNIKKQGVMLFGKVGYKFDHTWTEGEKTSSAIRIGDPVDAPEYWYIGVDKLNVNRMDFDFDTKKVILYSTSASVIGKTKYPYIFKALGISILGTILAIIFIRCFCQKKKQSTIREGEELAYL